MKNGMSTNNKGYSLVELIIVIAIIAVASSASLLSVTIIHSARAKDAAVKFDAEVTKLITQSKNMSPVAPAGDTIDYDNFALAVYKRNDLDKFVIAPAYYDAENGVTGGGHYRVFTDEAIFLPSSVGVTFNGITIGNYGTEVESNYYKSGDVEPKSYNSDFVYVRFDKRGNCASGYGTFKFRKRNGNVVSTVKIRQNGSHELK